MAKLKIAVVGHPGKWSTDVLADELEKRTGFRLVVDLTETELDLSQDKLMFQDRNLCQLDGIILRKIGGDYSAVSLERLELLRIAERAGVRVFSSATSLIRLLDRLACTITLHNARIAMPPTLVTESPDIAFKQAQAWGSSILKPLFSTKARGMVLLDSHGSPKEIKRQINRYKKRNPMIYLQKKVDLRGSDMGLIFMNNKYLGAYSRIGSERAWNTTIFSGGRYSTAKPDDAAIELAKRAQAAFNLDYATVDVAMTPDGPIVFEVSALGGFKGAKEGAQIDLASKYAQFAIKTIQNK